MKTGRLICNDSMNGASNMSIDCALWATVSEGRSIPVLRFYSWDKPVTTIGKFQKPEHCVNVDICHDDGISVIRRITGGGAVFHGRELTYSISVGTGTSQELETLGRGMKFLIGAVRDALRDMGFNAEIDSANDILVDGHKISGSAQFRAGGFVLHHGTVMLDDVSKRIERYLKRDHKGLGKKIDCMYNLAGIDNAGKIKKIESELRHGIRQRISGLLKIEFHESELTRDEIARSQYISSQIFDNEEWNQKGFPYYSTRQILKTKPV